jgi:4-carboxymuconolactone decarboxylase
MRSPSDSAPSDRVVSGAEPRLERLTPDALDAGQRALYDSITGGPRAAGPQHFPLTAPDGSLNGPFNALLRAPQLGTALQEVGAAIRYRTALSGRVREGAILLVAAHWNSAFERMAHEAVGRSSGLTDEDLATLAQGGIPASGDEIETASLEIVRLLLAGDIEDHAWRRWAPVVGERALFELTTLVGYYATLALQLRVFRVTV